MMSRGGWVLPSRTQRDSRREGSAGRIGIDPIISSHPKSSRIETDTPQHSNEHKVIPAFGWHPWFSHQIFLPSDYPSQPSDLTPTQKLSHYQSVLTPTPTDPSFLSSLPDPLSLSTFLSRTRAHVLFHPTALIGEIGLDRSFRIPEPTAPSQISTHKNESLTPGGREGRKLTPHRVSLAHQKQILHAQLALAGELQRPVSVHGVQAHGVLFETLAETWKGHERNVPSRRERRKRAPHEATEEERDSPAAPGPKPFPPRICLHSFSGPAETVRQYLHPSVPCEVFFSFSTTINQFLPSSRAGGESAQAGGESAQAGGEPVRDEIEDSQATKEGPTGREGKVELALLAVPADRVLVESDLHTAGEDMDGFLEEAVRVVCWVRGWGLEEGVKRLGANWRRFVFGELGEGGREEEGEGKE